MRDSKGSSQKGRMLDLESILDLNASNVWDMESRYIARLWEKERKEEDFSQSEEKILNVIRLAFEVVHFNPEDKREADRFETGWDKFCHCKPERGSVAIRRKTISRITDVTYENVKHISASLLLELIDKNFGGGWDSLSLALRDIIESGFEISTTQLPASRLHIAGGILDRKKADGFEVLEIPKGTWIEAIFAKKKEPIVKVKYTPSEYDDNVGDFGNEDSDEDLPSDNEEDEDIEDDNNDTFYSSYSDEAEVKPEDQDGFPLEEEE